MLKLLRKKKVAKRIYYALAAIIIPAFVVWGSASVLNKNKVPNYAGTIFGKKISYDEFRDALSGWKTQMKLQYGEKANEITKSFFKPSQAAWDRLIMLHEAYARHIKVKDSDIIAMITNFPFLQKDGRFDPATYDIFLKYGIGEYPRAFEEKLRQNIAMSKVFEETTKNITATDEEIRKEYEKQNIQTRVKYAFFPVKGYKDKVSVSEDEIKAYYEKNKVSFRVAPQINAAYIGIAFKEGISEAQKTEATEKIKKASVYAKTKGFIEAAKEAGLDTKETGLFDFEGPIPEFGWMPQLSTLLFDLPQGGISKILELKNGAYLFMIKEKKDAYLPDFNEAKEKAKDVLLNQKSKEFAQNKTQDFISSLKAKSLSFEEAAKEAGLEIKETPLFNREGYVPELGMADALKEAAFKLAKDEVAANPIELEQGYYAIKSIETILLDEEKFKKEKEEFAKNVVEQKRNKAFNDFFEDLRKRADLVSYIPDELAK